MQRVLKSRRSHLRYVCGQREVRRAGATKVGGVTRCAAPRFVCVCLAAALAAAATACSNRSGLSPTGKPGTIVLGMVTDVGGLGDKSFNDSAYRGLTLAKERLGVSTAVLQSRAVTDYEPNLAALAQQGDRLIFAIGFLMHDALNDVAPRFPRTHFAIIDSVVDQPNVTSVTFREEESSFLAGVLAALVSKTGTLGFLGGIPSPLIEKFQAGFTAGVRAVRPHDRVLVKYTGSFDDVAAGREYAALLFDQGADIVYAAAGKCGLGAIDEVKQRPRGDYIIGVDSDQDGLAPGRVLTSALKHVDRAVFDLARDAVRGRIPTGHLILGLREGGVGLSDMRYTRRLLPPGALATVDRYRSAIIAGRLHVPSSMAQLAAFHPAVPALAR
jgi:basic membrane protein A